MEEDPFPSITQQSQISSSQEEKLQNYPFAPELDAEDQASPWPVEVEPTGIVMVSLPDSCTDQFTLQEEEIYDFHVPPGHPCSPSISSSDDQGLAIVAVDGHHVGFDVEMLAVDGGCSDTEKTVDLGDTEPIVINTESIDTGTTQVLDSEFEENCEGLEASLTENTANVDKPMKETEVGYWVGTGDIAAQYVACGGFDKCRTKKSVSRRLEFSGYFEEQEKNDDGLSVPQVCFDKKKSFEELMLDVLEIFDDESGDTGVDFLETAKKRGLTFPWPRWWPPEGVADDIFHI